MAHVKTQAPYAFLVGAIAMFCGDLLSGYLYPMWAGLLVTIVVVLVVAYFISAKPDSENDKVDLVNRLCSSCGCCGLFAMLKSKKKGNGDGEGDEESPYDSDSSVSGKRAAATDAEGADAEGASSGGVADMRTLQMQSGSVRDGESSVEPSAHGGGVFESMAGGTPDANPTGTAPSLPTSQAPMRQGTL